MCCLKIDAETLLANCLNTCKTYSSIPLKRGNPLPLGDGRNAFYQTSLETQYSAVL